MLPVLCFGFFATVFLFALAWLLALLAMVIDGRARQQLYQQRQLRRLGRCPISDEALVRHAYTLTPSGEGWN